MKILFAIVFLTGCMHGGSVYSPEAYLLKALEDYVVYSDPNYKRFPDKTPTGFTTVRINNNPRPYYGE